MMYAARDHMYPTIQGWKVTFQVLSHIDAVIVPFQGRDSEEQAFSDAIPGIRNGYPDGPITLKRIEAGTWCPIGLPADEHSDIVYID